MYAVKRYVFRLGHAAGSGRFACSIEQLVVGLAPVMGWGAVPSGGVERARLVRAHRKSVQRWLDDLQAAGLVAHEPERDEFGRWWRTQIVLLRAPEPTADELDGAKARARGWRVRERARRRGRRRAPALGGIRDRAREPRAVARARLARVRAAEAHEARRRACVEAQISAIGKRAEQAGLLTHPFGAPPTSAEHLKASRRLEQPQAPEAPAPAAARPARTFQAARPLVEGTGARTRSAAAPTAGAAPVARKECTKEIGSEPPEDFDALVLRRIAAREHETAWRTAARREHALRRVRGVIAWPAGRACPIGRLREAWVAYRHGLGAVAEGGAAAAGPNTPAVAGRARRAIALYEEFAEQRPPGWPGQGPAALSALAGQRRAVTFAGDVARLLILAKGMRAAALEHDREWLDRARERAARRTVADDVSPVRFRSSEGPRWETGEQRRRRVRSAVLLVGENPAAWPNAALAVQHDRALGEPPREPRLVDADRLEELDGQGARAQRYRAQLAAGHWHAPDLGSWTP